MSTDGTPLHDFPDRAIRRLLQDPRNLAELIEAVVPDLAPSFDFDRAEVVDRSFLVDDWRRREADLLFRVPFRSPGAEVPALVCILLEHQSAPDPRMPLRILLYAVLYWEREWKAWEDRHPRGEPLRLTPVLPIVFHTGTEVWRAARNFGDLLGGPEELRPYAPQWRLLFWDLAEHSAEDLVRSAGAWLRALAVIRAEWTAEDSFASLYQTTLERLEELIGPEEVRRSELLWFLLSWAILRRAPGERERLVEIARTVQQDAERRRQVEQVTEMIEMTWHEELQEIARHKLDEGLRQGLRQGALENARQDLRAVLEERFGALPTELIEKIDACEEPETLRAMLRRSVRVASLEELSW